MWLVLFFTGIVCIIKMYMFSRIYNILYGFLGDSKQGGYDRGTTQYQWDCPECAEENGGTPDGKKNFETSFSLGRCHCWRCNFSGPISRVVKEYGGTEALKDYYAAVKDIKESKYYNIGLFNDIAENAYLNDYIKLPDTFTKIDLSKCRKKKLVEYLEKRHITQDIIDQHNIGYTTWDEEKWQMRDRIIIPSYDSAGDLNYWVGRDFSGNEKKMKYWNSKNDKNEIVFQESLIQWDATIYLCEGAVDCLYHPQSIALLGKSLSKNTKIFQELYEKARANIVICLDGDTDLKETKRLYNLLNIGRLRGKIRYIRLGTDEIPYKDFGEIYEAEGKTGMIKTFRQAKEFSEIELLV